MITSQRRPLVKHVRAVEINLAINSGSDSAAFNLCEKNTRLEHCHQSDSSSELSVCVCGRSRGIKNESVFINGLMSETGCISSCISVGIWTGARWARKRKASVRGSRVSCWFWRRVLRKSSCGGTRECVISSWRRPQKWR